MIIDKYIKEYNKYSRSTSTGRFGRDKSLNVLNVPGRRTIVTSWVTYRTRTTIDTSTTRRIHQDVSNLNVTEVKT